MSTESRDAELALSLLRRIAADRFALICEDIGDIIIDTGRMDAPDDEVDLVRRIRAEAEQ